MKNNQVTISRELAELLAQATAHPGHRDVEQALEEFCQVMRDDPPAQAPVVLPERMGHSTRGNGWNDCLAELKRLNPTL